MSKQAKLLRHINPRSQPLRLSMDGEGGQGLIKACKIRQASARHLQQQPLLVALKALFDARKIIVQRATKSDCEPARAVALTRNCVRWLPKSTLCRRQYIISRQDGLHEQL
eukprot:6210447-Pleurochrysis_carterae.AAC.1